MTSDQPRSVLCLGLNDADRSRVSEEAHRFGWLIRFAANSGDARATGNGRRPDLILFDTKTSDEAAHDLLRQCTAHPLQAVAPEAKAAGTAGATAWMGWACLLYTSPSPRDATLPRMPSSA